MAIRYDLGARDNTLDPWMNHALREIYSTYGQIASTTKKSKSLSKFGITRNADNGVKTTIADFQGTVVNETFVTTNIIDHAISTSTNDTGIITVEGHTIDGDGNLTFTVQDVTLTGQTKAPLTTPLARCTRAYVKDGTFASPSVDLQGIVSIYDDTGGQSAGGVPTVAAATKCRIRGDLGENQSNKCATSISSTDYWIIREIHFGMRRGSGGGSATVADCDIEVKRLGGVWRPVGLEVNLKTTVNVFEHVEVFPYVIIPPNADVRAIITADVNDTIAAARIEGVLATVDSFDYNRTE